MTDPNNNTGPAVGLVAAPNQCPSHNGAGVRCTRERGHGGRHDCWGALVTSPPEPEPWSVAADKARVLTAARAAEILSEDEDAPAHRDPSDASTWHLPQRPVTHDEALALLPRVAMYGGGGRSPDEETLRRYIAEREAAEARLTVERDEARTRTETAERERDGALAAHRTLTSHFAEMDDLYVAARRRADELEAAEVRLTAERDEARAAPTAYQRDTDADCQRLQEEREAAETERDKALAHVGRQTLAMDAAREELTALNAMVDCTHHADALRLTGADGCAWCQNVEGLREQLAEAITATLDCGHPAACALADDQRHAEAPVCGWCRDVAIYRTDAERARAEARAAYETRDRYARALSVYEPPAPDPLAPRLIDEETPR